MEKVKHIHEGFLKDRKSYEECERFWLDIVHKSAESHAQYLEPWFQNKFANGEPVLDGNPILALRHNRNKRVLRVIQYEPGEFSVDGRAFMSAITERINDDGMKVDSLTILLEASEETAQHVEKIAGLWFKIKHHEVRTAIRTANVKCRGGKQKQTMNGKD